MSRAEAMEQRFAVPVVAAALATVPLLAVEGAGLEGTARVLVEVAEWVIWLVFVVELVAVLSVVPNRRAWLREHPLELAVVVLTSPLLIALAPGVQALRVLRLLRLLRLARLARTAFSVTGLRYGALLALLTTVAGGEAYSQIERVPFFEGLYWAATTVTTVGYGDVTPDTAAGRTLAIAVMLMGIGFVAILTGAVAERFISADLRDASDEASSAEEELLAELRRIDERLARIEARLGPEAE